MGPLAVLSTGEEITIQKWIFALARAEFPVFIIMLQQKERQKTSMQKCGRLWTWPEKVDKLDYEWKAV